MAVLKLAGGGHLFVSPVIAPEKVENMSKVEIREETEKSHATLLLLCSDDSRYGDLSASLNSGTLRGREEYPETLASMYQLMIKHSSALDLEEIGRLKHFPMDEYYNPELIANVLSFKLVADLKGYYVRMNTKDGPGMYVVKDGKKLLFKHSNNGLFHCTIEDLEFFFGESNRNNIPNINLSSSRIHKYTKQEIEKAKQARDLQECLMLPSDMMMKDIIRNGGMTNNDITVRDVDRALELFGVAKEIVSGKMLALTKESNQSSQILLHDIIPKVDRRLKMYIDVLYINGHPYLHTKTKEANYITINRLQSMKARDIKRKLKVVIKKYLTRGFVLTDIFGNNKFAASTYDELFLPATLHICSRGKHVPIIECSIRTVKERARAASVHLPYSKVPSLMTASLLEGVEQWLNTFSRGIGNLSPSTIVDGKDKPRGDIERIPYGAYALVYAWTKNNMESRTIPAVALKESNGVCGHYFMSLETGKRIHSNKWIRKDITDDVINIVHTLAEKEKQPWIHEDPFTIFWSHDN